MFKLSENQTRMLARFRIALFLVLSLFGILAVANATTISFGSNADELDIEVDVVNSVPVFTSNPHEVPISSNSQPTNSDETMTILATAEDSDGDDYVLIVCSTSGTAIPNSGFSGNPECSSGITYCTSDVTAESEEAECEFQLEEYFPESNNWYAYACDSESCVEYTHIGAPTGQTSPFVVNHRPSFTAINATASANPGGTITFTTTASDSDIGGINDTVKLVVCKTNAAGASGCINGPTDTLCTSTLTSSNPSCDYIVPSVHAPQSITYYAFVFDNHNFESNDVRTGSFNINQVPITITNIATDAGSSITLTEGTTTSITASATLVDSNSCQDIDFYGALLYLSPEQDGICQGKTEGNYDTSKCVPETAVSCTIVSGNTCTGPLDTSVDIECTFILPYHLEPTGAATRYISDDYKLEFIAYDDGAPSMSSNHLDIPVDTLTALNVTSSITYGQLFAGQDTGSTNQTSTVTATGNVGLDVEISGTNLTNGSNTIPVANQKYELSAFNYSTGISLSTTPTNLEINVQKTTASNTPATKPIYWGIAIPAVAASGTYNGSVSITGLIGETAEW